jgi:hypothetical protein
MASVPYRVETRMLDRITASIRSKAGEPLNRLLAVLPDSELLKLQPDLQAVRLQLHALAYNLANFMRRAGDRGSCGCSTVVRHSTAAARGDHGSEDARRFVDPQCPRARAAAPEPSRPQSGRQQNPLCRPPPGAISEEKGSRTNERRKYRARREVDPRDLTTEAGSGQGAPAVRRHASLPRLWPGAQPSAPHPLRPAPCRGCQGQRRVGRAAVQHASSGRPRGRPRSGLVAGARDRPADRS